MRKAWVVLVALALGLLAASCGGGGGGESGSVQFVSFSTFSKYGYWAARGTVRNNTGDRVRWVKVRVNLMNAAGTVIDSDFSYIKTSDLSLAVGQSAAFELWAYGTRPANVAKYRYWLEYRR